VKLEIGITHDGFWQSVQLIYDLTILPMLFQFHGHDIRVIPLEEVHDEQVTAWVEERLLKFVETYLRLETLEQYQNENFVTDPVCGMRINKLHATAQMEYGGQTYYFCLSECQERFATCPDAYLLPGTAAAKRL
jgi:YHS domain-containing protein